MVKMLNLWGFKSRLGVDILYFDHVQYWKTLLSKSFFNLDALIMGG
jgi:hypothetical protein